MKEDTITLTAEQKRALSEIEIAWTTGTLRHTLSGDAGSGKTTLLPRIADLAKRKRKKIAFCAPTHKAAAVLRGKLRAMGHPHVECVTLDRLLCIKAVVDGDRKKFVRDKNADPIDCEIAVVDEASMVSAEKLELIRLYLPNRFVLFVGDPAQLPPVGERISGTFDVPSRSHLNEILRQGAGNPILDAARALREQQGAATLDMSWARDARAGKIGVFCPSASAVEDWLLRAFKNADFEKNPDRFRYLAYKNTRVTEVNAMIRRWRYGDNIRTPFVPGERAMFQDPLVQGEQVVFQNSEEGTVLEIAEDTYRHNFPANRQDEAWTAIIPAWRMTIVREDLSEHTVYAPKDMVLFDQARNRLRDEADRTKARWRDFHAFIGSMANVRPAYCLTVHKSQGSTFTHAFVDLPDILTRARDNVLETQQLLYVAATRPTDGLILIGADR